MWVCRAREARLGAQTLPNHNSTWTHQNSQRYRGWHYYPDWIIPPVCLNPVTCAQNTSGNTVDVFQLWSTPEDPDIFRGTYLQYDGKGYETYMATSTDMVHFDLLDPTLTAGQPGVIFSPRDGRPPLDGQPKPKEGEFDWGGITFIGPLLENYTVGAPSVLKRTSKGQFWFAYGAYPSFGCASLARSQTSAINYHARFLPHPAYPSHATTDANSHLQMSPRRAQTAWRTPATRSTGRALPPPRFWTPWRRTALRRGSSSRCTRSFPAPKPLRETNQIPHRARKHNAYPKTKPLRPLKPCNVGPFSSPRWTVRWAISTTLRDLAGKSARARRTCPAARRRCPGLTR